MHTEGRTPTLREVQAQLQTAILNGDDGILAALRDGSRASRETLLGVYRHAYTARLIEVLMSDYPLLGRYVGDEFFRRLANAFIAAHPSRSQNVRWFGTAFPDFIERDDSSSERPELAELAAIEKSIADAFDSADAPLLSLSEMALFQPQDWEYLTFAFHPSVAVLRTTINAFDIWKALKEEMSPPPAVRLVFPEHIAVWRYDATPRVRLMSDEEAMMCKEMGRSVRFSVLCEMLATCFDDHGSAPARAARYLHTWVTSGMIASAKVVARKRRGRSSHAARGQRLVALAQPSGHKPGTRTSPGAP